MGRVGPPMGCPGLAHLAASMSSTTSMFSGVHSRTVAPRTEGSHQITSWASGSSAHVASVSCRSLECCGPAAEAADLTFVLGSTGCVPIGIHGLEPSDAPMSSRLKKRYSRAKELNNAFVGTNWEGNIIFFSIAITIRSNKNRAAQMGRWRAIDI